MKNNEMRPKKPKPYTAKAKVLNLMNEAKKNAAEIEVGTEICTKDGRPLPQNSISMYLTSMGREFFSPGDRFYFRNCQKTGKRFVGYMFDDDVFESVNYVQPIETDSRNASFMIHYTPETEESFVNGNPSVVIGHPPRVPEFIEIKGYAFFEGAWSR